MRGGRNNLLAGALVVLSILAAVVVVVLLAGGLERLGNRDYRIRFDLAEGVTGLEKGSRVLVGGRQVGVVKAINFELTADGGATGLLVTVSIKEWLSLKQGAAAYLISPLLGGTGTIDFPSIGSGAALAPGDVIDGRIAPPTMLAQAGYGPEQAEQLRNIFKSADEATGKINTLMDDAKVVSADVRGKWPEWSARVDSISKNVDDAAAKAPKLFDTAQERVDAFKEVLDTVRGYLDENRANVKDSIASFKNIGAEGETFMARLNGELSDKAAGFMDDGRRTLADAEKAVETVQGLLDEQTPNIRRSMTNFRLASDQLATMMGEVRRSPWRLLYRPDTRELEFELLYDSARTYAAAVSDLRSAAETLQTVSVTNPDHAGAAELVQELDRSFDRYKEAESAFLEQIVKHSKGE
jgi:ABC-type transporter Mla subunit MlaD